MSHLNLHSEHRRPQRNGIDVLFYGRSLIRNADCSGLTPSIKGVLDELFYTRTLILELFDRLFLKHQHTVVGHV